MDREHLLIFIWYWLLSPSLTYSILISTWNTTTFTCRTTKIVLFFLFFFLYQSCVALTLFKRKESKKWENNQIQEINNPNLISILTFLVKFTMNLSNHRRLKCHFDIIHLDRSCCFDEYLTQANSNSPSEYRLQRAVKKVD